MWELDVSEPYGPSDPVIGIVLPFNVENVSMLEYK
jgi:hypothetical protein